MNLFFRKALSFILLVFSCVALSAQGTPNAIVVHQTNGKVTPFAIANIKSVTFPNNVMVVRHQTNNTRQFPFADVEWIEFANKTAAELREAVDLGLSVMWATCNVGATTPEGYGNWYAWGETSTKSKYAEQNYAYYTNGQYQYIGVNICGTKYDAARAVWGNDWRLPTRSEIRELTTKCTWTSETLNGVKGYRVTATNGNSIFLPAAGYKDGTTHKEAGTGGFYWSGSLDRTMTTAAYNLNFRGYDADWSASRAYGFSVRAVK